MQRRQSKIWWWSFTEVQLFLLVSSSWEISLIPLFSVYQKGETELKSMPYWQSDIGVGVVKAPWHLGKHINFVEPVSLVTRDYFSYCYCMNSTFKEILSAARESSASTGWGWKNHRQWNDCSSSSVKFYSNPRDSISYLNGWHCNESNSEPLWSLFASNFSSPDNSFHSLAARGPGGTKIQFSKLFQLSTWILFTLTFSLYLGTNILLNNHGLIRGHYER